MVKTVLFYEPCHEKTNHMLLYEGKGPVKKTNILFSRSDTNQAVQPQGMARGLKFGI